MGIEIERKFLVDRGFPIPFEDGYRITQGYLSQDPERTVRIRIYSKTDGDRRGSSGHITIKGKSTPDGLSRPEWEYEIPEDHAWDMIQLCTGVIDKTRYNVHHNDKCWEVDVFHGDNNGLVVAEIELEFVDDPLVLPDWVETEVTGDPKYYNSNLVTTPYRQWDIW